MIIAFDRLVTVLQQSTRKDQQYSSAPLSMTSAKCHKTRQIRQTGTQMLKETLTGCERGIQHRRAKLGQALAREALCSTSTLRRATRNCRWTRPGRTGDIVVGSGRNGSQMWPVVIKCNHGFSVVTWVVKDAIDGQGW